MCAVICDAFGAASIRKHRPWRCKRHLYLLVNHLSFAVVAGVVD